eukprot:Sdes_comp20796_c0_seq10m17062
MNVIEYSLVSYPSLYIFRGGELVDKYKGPRSWENLLAFILKQTSNDWIHVTKKIFSSIVFCFFLLKDTPRIPLDSAQYEPIGFQTNQSDWCLYFASFFLFLHGVYRIVKIAKISTDGKQHPKQE